MARTIDPALNEKRRQQVLRAAAGCFAVRGFHQTTMQEIVAAAGISAGGLYRYYKTKDDIVVGIAEAEALENAPLIEALERNQDPLAALEEITPWILKAYDDPGYGRLAIEVLSEAGRNPRVAEILARNERELRGALEQALARGQEQGLVDNTLSSKQQARLVMALYGGLLAGDGSEARTKPSRLKAATVTLLRKFLSPPA